MTKKEPTLASRLERAIAASREILSFLETVRTRLENGNLYIEKQTIETIQLGHVEAPEKLEIELTQGAVVVATSEQGVAQPEAQLEQFKLSGTGDAVAAALEHARIIEEVTRKLMENKERRVDSTLTNSYRISEEEVTRKRQVAFDTLQPRMPSYIRQLTPDHPDEFFVRYAFYLPQEVAFRFNDRHIGSYIPASSAISELEELVEHIGDKDLFKSVCETVMKAILGAASAKNAEEAEEAIKEASDIHAYLRLAGELSPPSEDILEALREFDK